MTDEVPNFVLEIGNCKSRVYNIAKNNIVQDKYKNRDSDSCFYITKYCELGFSSVANSFTCALESNTTRNTMRKLMETSIINKEQNGSKEKENIEDKEVLTVHLYDGEEISIKNTEALAIYMKWILKNDEIKDKNKPIGIVIPKFFDDRAKARILQAAELAGCKNVVPVLSTTAHIVSYMQTVPFGDKKEKIVILMNSGSYGFEIAYWRVTKEKATLLQYNYFDLGGNDITEEYAESVFKQYTSSDYPKEVNEFFNKIIEENDIRNCAIIRKESEKLKERLIPSGDVLFNPEAISIEEISFTSTAVEFEERVINTLNSIESFISKSFGSFILKMNSCIVNPKDFKFDISLGGGNNINILIQKIINRNCEVPKLFEINGQLPLKEFSIEGAAAYLENREHWDSIIVDNIHPYKYYIKNEKYIHSKQNEKVFIKEAEHYSKNILGIRKDAKLFKLSDREEFNKRYKIDAIQPKYEEIVNPKFNSYEIFDINEIPDVETDYAKIKEEDMESYRNNIAAIEERNNKVEEMTRVKNDFQQTYYHIKDLCRDKRLFGAPLNPEESKDLLDVSKECSNEYDNHFTDSTVDELEDLERYMVEKQVAISNIVIKKISQPKQLNRFLRNYPFHYIHEINDDSKDFWKECTVMQGKYNNKRFEAEMESVSESAHTPDDIILKHLFD